MNKKMWKFLRTGMKSNHGNCTWVIGKWKKQSKNPQLCESGFHASTLIQDALGYVKGEILAEVEVKGKSDIQDDKECWSEMCIVRAWEVDKKFYVSLAVFATELSLHNYENKYTDTAPRLAIQAAIKWINDPTEENASAARSAEWSAEWSAASSAAESAAWSAARSAASAARSAAESAAESAASAASSAAWSAASSAAWSAARSAEWSAEWSAASSAAESAAWSAARNKIHKYAVSLLKEMDCIEGSKNK